MPATNRLPCCRRSATPRCDTPENRDSPSTSRLDRSRDRATGGYGLGLTIVKKIADRLDGTVHVGNSDLGGAKFVLNFPL
ncbi:ATP-binding protein [Collimonas silvisoli]|uniref:ATP-binding protein n=1 Tax=Collimonas silvisoli TaxID=2825884 RepID=UPI001B8ABF64|nr:ATP-binding protein [Collimonas silvisoli]